MKKLTIVSVCGFGIGSSIILKMTIDKMLADEGIEADVQPQDITSLGGTAADIVFTSVEFADRVRERMSCPVITVNSFIDLNEVREKGLGLIREFMLM